MTEAQLTERLAGEILSTALQVSSVRAVSAEDFQKVYNVCRDAARAAVGALIAGGVFPATRQEGYRG